MYQTPKRKGILGYFVDPVMYGTLLSHTGHVTEMLAELLCSQSVFPKLFAPCASVVLEVARLQSPH